MPNPLIGIIAEDESDVECIKHFIRRNKPEKQIGFKKFVGHGCGRIHKKANAWANNFKTQGCNSIILVHDLDRNDKDELYKNICDAFLPSPIKKYCICIPIEELEAWLLSDIIAIKKVFNIKTQIKLPNYPEKIPSPKEYLNKIVRKATNKKVDYINTIHNKKIAEIISLKKMYSKCETYREFQDFVDVL